LAALLQSTFEGTGGNGIMIKGYDPVILDNKCVTTFMAVTPAPDVEVYYNVVEFDAAPVQGGTLCNNGKWRSMDAAPPRRRGSGCSSRTASPGARLEPQPTRRACPDFARALSTLCSPV